MDHAVMNDLLNKDSEKGCKLISALRNEGMSPFSSTILLERCRHFINEGTCDIIAHLLLYLASLASNMKVIDPIRRGCTQIVPGLIAQPIWNTSLFPWIAKLEAATSDIRNEFLALRGHTGPCEGFQTYSDSTVAQGDWHVCYLQLHTVDFAANRALCPLTMEAIGQAPRGYGHAFFSALSGGTHISAHHGPTNKKLRVFLPLVLQPKQAYLTVNHTEIELEEGRAVVFDDSFLHSSRNILSGVPRIALIFDIWHPDLTDEEVRLFSFLTNCQVRAAQKLHEKCMEDTTAGEIGVQVHEGDDFLSGILKHRARGLESGAHSKIWGYAQQELKCA